MRCDECILEAPSQADLPFETFMESLGNCDECPAVASRSPALVTTLARLRSCAHVLRKTQSRLRQRDEDLSAALEATAQYEARIEKMGRVYTQSVRELEPQLEVVERQAETIRALSAPILEVGHGVVAMPIIGAVDRDRESVITNALLRRVHERPTRLVVIDLTGLDEVDASTAKHLLRTCGALRLLGTKVVLCGLRSSVAKRLVHLDADLSVIETLTSLRSALERYR